MTNKTPAYQWYPRDFAADEPVVLMSLEEEGAYRRLLDHQWLHGSIPDDVRNLAHICKAISPARMRKIWRAVSPCFTTLADQPGRLANAKLERVRAEAEAYREAKRISGKAGGEAKAARKRMASSATDSLEVRQPFASSERVTNPSSASATASATAESAADAALGAALLDRVPERFRGAVQGAIRASRNPQALVAELEALESGLTPPAYPVAVIGQALHEMAVAGAAITPRAIRAFCRGVRDGVSRDTPETPGERVLRLAAEQDEAA